MLPFGANRAHALVLFGSPLSRRAEIIHGVSSGPGFGRNFEFLNPVALPLPV